MRFPIRLKILAVLAVDLLLMVILGFVATQLMRVMNERASMVATHTIPALNSVADLKSQVNAYRVNQLEYMLYTSEADKSRSLRRMNQVEAQVTGALEAYRPLIRSEAERRQLGEFEQAWATLVQVNYERFIPDATLNNTGTVRPFYSRMNPYYSDVEAALRSLSDTTQYEAGEELAVVQRAYQTARSFIVIDTLLAVVVSAAIGLFLAGRIALRLGRLTSAAGKVAAGDLDRTVEARGGDELSQLADAFNRMVSGLRSQRSALEERNAALVASLARQEQLTADLMRRRQAEEEAYRAQAAAEAASQAKSMFLATMSHELRTPLNAILGYAQILRLSGPHRTTDMELDPLERILAAGRHLTTLVNNVLDFSKIEQGVVDLAIAQVAVADMVREAADVIRPLAEQRGNELRVLGIADAGVIVTDAGRVRQVLINLLANATKFTDQGTVTLRTWREGEGAAAGAANGGAPQGAGALVIFEVSDTGIGIAPEHLGRLFQPFSQIDSSVTRRFEGTGLGLALSRQLVLALGGTISVTSEPGRGSTFTVRLPAAAPESALAGIAPSSRPIHVAESAGACGPPLGTLR